MDADGYIMCLFAMAGFDDKQGCLCYLSLTMFGWVEIVEFGCGWIYNVSLARRLVLMTSRDACATYP